jgi:hypothetical protein
MKFEAGSIYFNKIYIIQSLREGDRLTGQELFDDIISRRTSSSMVAEIKNIASKADLVAYFRFIYQSVNGNLLPFIHFETHGFKDGLVLSGGEEISWKELVPYFRQINIATKNNLFISVAACQGGNIQFCVKITEPSPFRGFIGPMEEVGEYDILNSYSEFFNVLLLENDIEKGIDALNSTAQGVHYHHMNVESFFEIAWEYHQKLWNENPQRQRDLVNHIMAQQVTKNPNLISVHGSRRKWRRSIERFVKKDKPKVLEILRNQFCHIQ